MKQRLGCGLVATLVAIGIASTTVSAQALRVAGPGGTFGSPPSGEVPIIFNDRYVYAKPDRLKANRVLAALVRDNAILVPLRAMFEWIGATVSYDPASKTVDVDKPNYAHVKLTVGKPEVLINGASRPLDVPPEIYKGAIVVPVRVLAESMGAYVQWLPDRRIVVVRYLQGLPPTPAPPQPTAPTTPTTFAAPPSPPATPTPTPLPTAAARHSYEHFIVGDAIFSPKVYNEFSPGNSGKGGSYSLRGAVEFPAFGLPWMLEGDYRAWRYPHDDTINPFDFIIPAPDFDGNPCPHAGVNRALTPATGDQGCVTVIGAYGQTPVPSFTARDTDFDGRLGLKIAEPRIYIGVGYLHREENYGYPKQNGFGFGAEKLPDLDQPLSIYGSVWYYPSISGNFTYPCGPNGGAPPALACTTDKFQQRFLKYQIGGTLNLGASGLFLDAGLLGDSIRGKNISPGDASHAGGYIGLGIKF